MKWTSYEAFAGIGAWGKALERVSARHGDSHKLLGYWEFDKYASNAFAAIHGVSEDLNHWDITEDKHELEHADIFFYSPPCQTFSPVGNRSGTSDEKGNLFFMAAKKIEAINPKFCIMENTYTLSTEFSHDLHNMLGELESIGYVNFSKVLNALDFGSPQNRQRTFIVSIRKDAYESGVSFEWPVEKTKTIFVKDVVDYKIEVPRRILEQYYNKKGEFGDRFKTLKGGSNFMALTTKGPWAAITQNYYTNDLEQYSIYQVIERSIPVFALSNEMAFKIQGFDYEDYMVAKKRFEDTYKRDASAQLHIRTGNTIYVGVIEEILENLLYQRKQEGAQLTLF